MNVQKLKKFRENTAGLESRNPEIISNPLWFKGMEVRKEVHCGTFGIFTFR